MSIMTSKEIKKKILLLNDLNGHIPTLSLNKYLEMYSKAIIFEHKEAVISSLRDMKEYDEDTARQKVTRAIRTVTACVHE